MNPLKIGNVSLQYPLFLAPMAGVTDYAFRKLCREMGAAYTVSEMVSAKALCYDTLCKKPNAGELSRTAPLARIRADEFPMSIQLFGSDPAFMARAARMLAEGSYVGCRSEIPPVAIDINMGCPVAKVVGNGEGSALMKNPALAAAIVRAVADAIAPLPVTVKIRSGWDSASVNAPEMAKRLADAGAAAICVHARTREQMYAPGADYSVIAAVKKAVDIPVIGNGDIRCAADAAHMYEISGCDGFMVARGAEGNPWLFAELRAWLEEKSYTPPTPAERYATAMRHAAMCVADKGERIGIPEIRKHMAWYLKGCPGAASARNAIMTAATVDELRCAMQVLLDSQKEKP